MKPELTYIRSGDYWIPNLKLESTEERPLNKYGRMRRTFLREHKPIQYSLLETEAITEELQRQHDDILSFADLYDSAGIEAKKMVVSAMIRRVEVSRDYKLTIYFNFNLDQFLHGLDCGGTIQAGGV